MKVRIYLISLLASTNIACIASEQSGDELELKLPLRIDSAQVAANSPVLTSHIKDAEARKAIGTYCRDKEYVRAAELYDTIVHKTYKDIRSAALYIMSQAGKEEEARKSFIDLLREWDKPRSKRDRTYDDLRIIYTNFADINDHAKAVAIHNLLINDGKSTLGDYENFLVSIRSLFMKNPAIAPGILYKQVIDASNELGLEKYNPTSYESFIDERLKVAFDHLQGPDSNTHSRGIIARLDRHLCTNSRET